MAYTVVSGDTLGQIAIDNGMTLAELLELNPDIKDPNKIGIGLVVNTKPEEAGKEEEGGPEKGPEAGIPTEGVVPEEESKVEKGIGRQEGEEGEVTLQILTSEFMVWYFDEGTGKWYVSYKLPNSNRFHLFEADPDQMDALFGEGFRPSGATRMSLKTLLGMGNITFAGNIGEMTGTGSFEEEVARITALALDDGKLPKWAAESGAAMDIIFTAHAEGKSEAWILEQLSQLPSFKARFPKIQKFMEENNMTLGEGIAGWLEYEAGVTRALKASGMTIEADPEMIGNLLTAGHSLTTINDTVQGFRRMKQYAPAMEAFNEILAAQGLDTITTIQQMLDFMQGRASAEIYDLYEASSIQEAAVAAGLGHLFSAEDALAAANAGEHTLQSAIVGMQKSAEMILRLRHEVDIGKFGLSVEDLIDINLGQAPRSGASQADIQSNINRAVLSAQGAMQKRATPFRDFGRTGSPGSASLRGLRQES